MHVCIKVDTVYNQCQSWPFELLRCYYFWGNRPDTCTTETWLMHRINGSKEDSNLILELDTIPICMPLLQPGKKKSPDGRSSRKRSESSPCAVKLQKG